VGKNSRYCGSEPETPLQMRHTTTNAESAGIASLAVVRVCRPPFVKGAGVAAPGDFVCSGCLMSHPIYIFAIPAGGWAFATQENSVNFPAEIHEEAFIQSYSSTVPSFQFRQQWPRGTPRMLLQTKPCGLATSAAPLHHSSIHPPFHSSNSRRRPCRCTIHPSIHHSILPVPAAALRHPCGCFLLAEFQKNAACAWQLRQLNIGYSGGQQWPKKVDCCKVPYISYLRCMCGRKKTNLSTYGSQKV